MHYMCACMHEMVQSLYIVRLLVHMLGPNHNPWPVADITALYVGTTPLCQTHNDNISCSNLLILYTLTLMYTL